MAKIEQESDIKSKLVLEICSISTWKISCIHQQHCTQMMKSSLFIDWYAVLGVGDDARIDVIRKQYHKLALQLHPDKNKHPMAGTAFKLVSEAHTCLSDEMKRGAYNIERRKSFCYECKTIPYTKGKRAPKKSNSPSEFKFSNHSKSSSSMTNDRTRILEGLKDMKDRFIKDTKVIDNCLRVKARASSNESSLLFRRDSLSSKLQEESPIFNPSDYVYQSYPHCRAEAHKTADNFWRLRQRNVLNCDQGRGKCDYPLI